MGKVLWESGPINQISMHLAKNNPKANIKEVACLLH